MPADLRTLIEQELEAHAACHAPSLERFIEQWSPKHKQTPEAEATKHRIDIARISEVRGFHRALYWVLALLPPRAT